MNDFGGFGGNFFGSPSLPPGQMGNFFPMQSSGLDPKFSPFAYGNAPSMSASQIAGLSNADFNAIGKIGSGQAAGGMPWGMLFQGLGSIAGQGGAPAPQTQTSGKPSGMIDPLYMIKQYAPQIAARYSAAVPVLNTPVPRIGGLLG